MVSRTSFTDEEAQAIERQPVSRPLVGLLPALVGNVCLAWQWPSRSWAVMLPLTLVTAYSMLCYTSCLHETIHQTLFRRTRLNVTLGRMIGAVIWVPYTAYRETHIRHHAYLNTPDDWELWPYASPHASMTFRRVFVWFDLLLGLIASPVIYGRIFFHPRSPLQSRAVRRSIRYEYGLSIALWTTALTIIAWNQLWAEFTRAWLVPALLAGLLQSGRKLTEHLGMASYDPLLGTRTVIGRSWLTRFCSKVNFDIFVHGPHHRYPRLPHTALAAKMQEYADSHQDVELPVFTSYHQAVWAMVQHVIINPGSGVNAGGRQPPRPQASITDFTSDVLA